ncbi:acyl carrier protein [Roseburia sp. BX1005]|uniref:Acyl carrier protein n=1 Tax=Roseburia zhanii TaxID=2763064 RepID=A0A923LQZ4_9FIRM|nr:acyl carrier protein [Roseburia zhanii]MBC5714286.1 acyl carrier protein [Roseburia zhanii]
MEEFLKLLKKIKPNVDFTKEQALVDDGLLESLDIISIISEVAEVYGVLIPSDEIIPDNFNSAEAMYELIEDFKEN